MSNNNNILPVLPSINYEKLHMVNGEHGILHRSVYTEIRKGELNCAPVVLRSFRQTKLKVALEIALSRENGIIQLHHPNIVQLIGAIYKKNNRATALVYEFMPTTLYECLHEFNYTLTLSEIINILISVAAALDAIHQSNNALLNLTSRKVLMDGNKVKLTGVGNVSTYKAAGIIDLAVLSYAPTSSNDDSTDSQHDIYSFGVLIHEVCLRKKPDNEMLNETMQLAAYHLELERMAKECISTDCSKRPSASVLVRRLRVITMPSDTTDSKYGIVPESEFIKSSSLLSKASSNSTTSTTRPVLTTVLQSRLKGVEASLVKEQQAFDDLQKNFKSTTASLNQSNSTLENVQTELSNTKVMLNDTRNTLDSEKQNRANVEEELEMAKLENERLRRVEKRLTSELEMAKEDIVAQAADAQVLSEEITTLSRTQSTLQETIESTSSALRDAQDEAKESDVRWSQAASRLRHESLSRVDADKKVRALLCEKKILLAKVDSLDPEKGSVTLATKAIYESKVEKLSAKLENSIESKSVLQRDYEKLKQQYNDIRDENSHLNSSLQTLKKSMSEAESIGLVANNKIQNLSDTLASVRQDYDTLEASLSCVNAELDQCRRDLVAEKNARLEEQYAREHKKCLTSKCESPSVLVQDSGYCIDCELARDREAAAAAEKAALLNDPEKLLRNALKTGAAGLSTALEAYATNEQFVLLALKTIKQSCKDDKDGLKDEIGYVSGIQSIVKATLKHSSNPQVAQYACQAFEFLAFNHEQNRIILVADGALDVVLPMMTSHPDNSAVQERGCTTITNLSHNAEANRKRIVQCGGLEVILNAMQRFVHNANVQKRACWALLTLAGSDYLCEKIVAEGGIGAILAAMLNCAGNAEVQHYGCWALSNLVSVQTEIQEFAVNEGAVEVCEAAIACFPEHDGIQDKAQEVLDVLCDD